MGVCAKDDLLAISLSPQQPFPSSPMFGQGVSPGDNRATHCATWAPVSLRGNDSEPDLGSPKTLIPRDEESSEEDRPFLPRFLLQEMIFAHSPYEGENQPRLQGDLLCRSD